ncbi:MAG: SCO family protein [Woeseiaceae bacterium]|nr:SCO family protein [Woeseiaceae bacterium]
MRTDDPGKRLRKWIPALLALCMAYGLAVSAAHGGDAGSVESSHSAPSTGSRITTPGLDSNEAFRTSQAAVGTTPRDYTLLDREGKAIQLSSYRGRPLLVSFIYTGCFHICPVSTRALHKAVRALHQRFGDRQFNVVTIGFDQPEDSPEALDAYARQQRISDKNWEFLSPDSTDVAALSRDFGFTFVATPAGFDHTLQVSVLDAQGEIYRQIYGDSFTAEKIGEPLRQLLTGARLVDGTVGLADLIDRVRILCSVYDPATGTYRADYTLYLMIAGGLTFFVAMLWFLVSELRGRMLRGRAKGPA